MIIDRFEGDFAVCRTALGEILNIEREKVHKSAREGDILKLQGEIYFPDKEQTETRRAALRERMDRLIKKRD